MSWFSVTQHGKSLWDQHALAKSIFTGSFVGDFIFRKGIKDNCINKAIKETASEVFALIVTPKFFPYSKEIATTVLTNTLKKEKLFHVGERLKQNITTQNVISAGKTSFYALKNMTGNYLYKNPTALIEVFIHQPSTAARKITDLIKFTYENYQNYTTEEAKELTGYLKQFEISQAAHKAMVLNLTPHCERAVKASMMSATKALGNTAYDFTIKKIVSLVTIPLIYKAVLMTAECSAGYFDNNLAKDLGALTTSAQNIVTPNTLLWGLAAINTLDMMYIFWNAKQSAAKPSLIEDIDKEEVKQLAFRHLKAPIAKKLQENAFINSAGISDDHAQIDIIASTLIKETVDLYWKDLKSQKVLGLPLVS